MTLPLNLLDVDRLGEATQELKRYSVVPVYGNRFALIYSGVNEGYFVVQGQKHLMSMFDMRSDFPKTEAEAWEHLPEELKQFRVAL